MMSDRKPFFYCVVWSFAPSWLRPFFQNLPWTIKSMLLKVLLAGPSKEHLRSWVFHPWVLEVQTLSQRMPKWRRWSNRSPSCWTKGCPTEFVISEGALKKTFWTKASNWILFETALNSISPKCNGKVPNWRSDFGGCSKKLFEVPNLFVFAKRRCPTGALILEGALKKTSEPRPPIGFFLNQFWKALAPNAIESKSQKLPNSKRPKRNFSRFSQPRNFQSFWRLLAFLLLCTRTSALQQVSALWQPKEFEGGLPHFLLEKNKAKDRTASWNCSIATVNLKICFLF